MAPLMVELETFSADTREYLRWIVRLPQFRRSISVRDVHWWSVHGVVVLMMPICWPRQSDHGWKVHICVVAALVPSDLGHEVVMLIPT